MIWIVLYIIIGMLWQASVAVRLRNTELYRLTHRRMFIVAGVAVVGMVLYFFRGMFGSDAVAGIVGFWLVMVVAFCIVWVALIAANVFSAARYGQEWMTFRNRSFGGMVLWPVGILSVEKALRSEIVLRVECLFSSQTRKWPLARKNFSDLRNVRLRSFDHDGYKIYVQCNPARIISTTAKIDKDSIAGRKCFLCPANRPKEQDLIAWRDYDILVNPYPIFDPHLTIPCREHQPQLIKSHLGDMLDLAHELKGWAVFYNGPKCGASAPDHFHFQAVRVANIPLYSDYENLEHEDVKENVVRIKDYSREVLCIEGSRGLVIETMENLYADLHYDQPDDEEPMMNVVCVWTGRKWRLFVIPRLTYRPSQYFEGKYVISPGTIEMCGVMIAPKVEDYGNITLDDILDIYRQVSYVVGV